MPFHVSIDHTETANNSSRSGSSVTDEESSSGTGNTGVQVPSPASAIGSHERDEYSDSVEEDNSWNHIYPDDIGPSDSASRPRTSNQHRPIVEAPEPERPQPRRRQSSRRQILRESIPHHPHPRTRAPPQPPTAPGSVESYEEWAPQAPGAYVRTRPPPHDGHVYWAAVPGNPQHNYSQSYSSPQAYSPYQTSGPAVGVGQQLVPFGNPGYGHTPYQGAPGGAPHGYFPPGAHGAPPMGSPMMPPPGASPYTGQELMHRAPNAGYFQYPHNFAMPQPMPQPMVQPAIYPTYVYSPQPTPAPVPTPTPAPAPAAAPPASTPAAQPTPPPAAESPKVDEHFARFEKILMDERADREAREAAAKQAAEDAAAKAAAEKKIADDIAAASNAAAAAATEEAEKRAQEALAKAKEEADAAAAKAKEEADAAAKAAVEAATPAPGPPPPPEEKKKPIKFKDAVGRKFSFPFHLCSTWMGMEDLIRQAFLHVEVIGPHVAEGHYDLVGPQGDIILPQVWETVVEPDWTITMHMWPMPEPPPPEAPPADPVVDVPPVPPPAPDGKPAKKSINRKKGGGFSSWWAAGAPKPKPKPTKSAKKPT